MKKVIVLSALSLLLTLSGMATLNASNFTNHKPKTEIKKTKQEKKSARQEKRALRKSNKHKKQMSK
ncbi:MAG: hypothetical protein ABI761_07865 [Saprospiraceae bacterium]